MSQKFSGVPLKEEITDRQLGPILAILRELQPYLLEEVVEQGGTPAANEVDGGVESAAATTFLKACSRLDSILEDESRWSLKTHNTLVAEMVKTQRAQQKFIAVQQASSENLQAPHFLLRPTLAITAGRYIAYWGDIHTAGQAIIGQGDTPNEAFADFDDAFDKTPNEQIYLVAEKTGVKLPPADPPKE